MATKTGRLVMDRKTGEMVEEMKEDQMLVALYDPACAKPGDHTFQPVLRSDFTAYVSSPCGWNLHNRLLNWPWQEEDQPAVLVQRCAA